MVVEVRNKEERNDHRSKLFRGRGRIGRADFLVHRPRVGHQHQITPAAGVRALGELV